MRSLTRAAKCASVISLLFSLAAESAAAPPVEAPWLRYEVRNSMFYSRIELTAISATHLVVFVDGNTPEREPVEYTATLSPAEAKWLRMIVEAINFDNPDRLDFTPAGGHGGIITVNVSLNNEKREARFGRDDSFDDLAGFVWKLVHQAEILRELERYHQPRIYHDLAESRVLQPQAFVRPLVKYIREQDGTLDEALLALTVITTPEQWGGVVGEELAASADKHMVWNTTMSRRDFLFDLLTGHPFYEDLPKPHAHVLIRILRAECATKLKQRDTDAADFVERVDRIEQRIMSSEE